jgi:hypothetical protein
MTLLENTYRQLRSAGLVRSAEAFSSTYLNKNKNWYAYQKHTGRDYSVDAAIQCLRGIRSQKCVSSISTAQHELLEEIEQQLLAHLNSQHCVADVC